MQRTVVIEFYACKEAAYVKDMRPGPIVLNL